MTPAWMVWLILGCSTGQVVMATINMAFSRISRRNMDDYTEANSSRVDIQGRQLALTDRQVDQLLERVRRLEEEALLRRERP